MSIHRMPTADRLRDAAHVSIRISARDSDSGYRSGDPLHTLIPGNGQTTAEVLALVRFITGRTIERGPSAHAFQNTAPAARAALRRWAHLNGENEP